MVRGKGPKFCPEELTLYQQTQPLLLHLHFTQVCCLYNFTSATFTLQFCNSTSLVSSAPSSAPSPLPLPLCLPLLMGLCLLLYFLDHLFHLPCYPSAQTSTTHDYFSMQTIITDYILSSSYFFMNTSSGLSTASVYFCMKILL